MGRYSVSRKKKRDKVFCLNCGKENEWKHGHVNKYCNLLCFREHQFKITQLPLIIEGKASEYVMKRYLMEQHGNICMICGQLGEWNGKPLNMQMDHINGNSDDNRRENLRLVCPNCHSQTPTFGSRGLGKRYKKNKNTKRNEYLRNYKGA